MAGSCTDAGAVSLLQTLRTAAGARAADEPAIAVVLPVPGDVRGLAGGHQFERDALAAGEAIIVATRRSGAAVGLVPDFGYDETDPDDDDDGVPELEVAHCPGRCTRSPGTRRRAAAIWARPSTHCAPPCGRPPTR